MKSCEERHHDRGEDGQRPDGEGRRLEGQSGCGGDEEIADPERGEGVRVDDQVASTILEHLEASEAPMRVAQLRVLGGAMARVPAEATAFAHRHRAIMVKLAAFYDGPADKAVRQAWVDRLAAALQQDDQGVYVNFVGDEGPARVRQAFPGPTWERLATIKHRWDPTNLFRHNQNIPPTTT